MSVLLVTCSCVVRNATRHIATVVFRRFLPSCRYPKVVTKRFLVVILANIFFTCLVIRVVRLAQSLGTSPPPEDGTPTTNGTGYYVTLCTDRIYGPHRTGNQLFLFTAALFVAHHTGRTLTLPAGCRWSLESVFQTDIKVDVSADEEQSWPVVERYQDARPPPCPCRQLNPEEGTPFIHGDYMLDTDDGLRQLMTPNRLLGNDGRYVLPPLLFNLLLFVCSSKVKVHVYSRILKFDHRV